jgi:protein ImuB
MHWLCLLFPQLALEALDGNATRGDVVVDRHGSQRWAITAAGPVTPGMPLALARLKAPEARILERDLPAETAALYARAHIAYGIGAPVVAEILGAREVGAIPQPCVWVEISASQRLFGGLEALRDRLLQTLVDNRLSARVAIAPSRAAAALLARCGDTHPCLNTNDLATRIAPRPLAALPWPQAWQDRLRGVGIRRIGELAALPRSGLQRRFGAELLLALDRLYARAPEPFTALVPPESFDQRLELLEEVAHVEALGFPLRRLVGQLSAWLALRDQRLQRYRLELQLAWDQCPPVSVELLQAADSLDALFIPLREQLMQTPPPAPVRALRLVAERIVETRADQQDAFAPRQQSQDWAAALDRLRARFGAEAVWTPLCVDDHRPAFASRPGLPGSEGSPPPVAARPLWWQAQALPLPQPPPLRASERIEGGWWSEAPLRADYGWADVDGREAWVRRDLSGDPLGDRAWVEGWMG